MNVVCSQSVHLSLYDSYDGLPEPLQEDVRESAEELIQQLQPQLNENLQVRHRIRLRMVTITTTWSQVQLDQMMLEFNTVDKLQELARLKTQYHNHGPAWLVE